MSTFVLNRNYELQLPNSYVNVDREEMEYVDGGGTCSISIAKATQVKVLSSAYGYFAKVQGGVIGAVLGVLTLPFVGPYGAAAIGAIAGTILADTFSWAYGGISAYLINNYGSDLKYSVTAWYLPNKSISI